MPIPIPLYLDPDTEAGFEILKEFETADSKSAAATKNQLKQVDNTHQRALARFP